MVRLRCVAGCLPVIMTPCALSTNIASQHCGAFLLLARFTSSMCMEACLLAPFDLCRAVDLALSVGIFPYVLKLLQTII